MIYDVLRLGLKRIEKAINETPSACRRKTVYVTFVGRPQTTYPLFSNGPARGVACKNEVGNCGCCHAEVKAILWAVTSYGHLSQWTGRFNYPCKSQLILINRYSPCTPCAHLIAESGIVKGLVYEEETPHDLRGLEIIKSAGIPTLTGHDLRDCRPYAYRTGNASDVEKRTHDTIEQWQADR